MPDSFDTGTLFAVTVAQATLFGVNAVSETIFLASNQRNALRDEVKAPAKRPARQKAEPTRAPMAKPLPAKAKAKPVTEAGAERRVLEFFSFLARSQAFFFFSGGFLKVLATPHHAKRPAQYLCNRNRTTPKTRTSTLLKP